MRFEVVTAVGPFDVIRVSGGVERLGGRGWEEVQVGQRLQDGERLQVGAESTLILEGPNEERMEFLPAPKVRFVQLQLTAGRQHGI